MTKGTHNCGNIETLICMKMWLPCLCVPKCPLIHCCQVTDHRRLWKRRWEVRRSNGKGSCRPRMLRSSEREPTGVCSAHVHIPEYPYRRIPDAAEAYLLYTPCLSKNGLVQDIGKCCFSLLILSFPCKE